MKDYIGKIIVAPPTVTDSYWAKTVVFITEHDDLGSIGLILNKPSTTSLQLFGKKSGFELDYPGFAHIGGPTHAQALTILHTPEWRCKNTLRLDRNFSMSSSPNALQRISEGDTPKQWRLFVGLATWAPEQLSSEVYGLEPFTHEHSWLIATPTHDNVFEFNEDDQWIVNVDKSASDFAKKMLV